MRCAREETQERDCAYAEDWEAVEELTGRRIGVPDRSNNMQKRTTIILLTILCWGLIVALCGYQFVSSGLQHPSALTRVPVDPEAVALEKIW